MESRLKERLTGAAILVALIVLIVPEIFHDRRSAPTPPGISTGSPAEASTVPTRSYTIELAPQPPAAAPAGADAPPVVGPRPAAEPAAAEAKPAAGAVRAPVTAHGLREKPVAAPPAPRVVTAASPKTRVASASASSSSHGRGGGWTVQLGLFAKSANAERLAHTAQSHGFDVAISRFGARGLYRVAVAGIADRAAAEQLSHRLQGAGLPAAILGPR